MSLLTLYQQNLQELALSIPVSASSISVSGGDAMLLYGRAVIAQAGATNISGAPTSLLRDSLLVATPGFVSVTPVNASLLKASQVSALPSGFALYGGAQTFSRSYQIAGAPGAITLAWPGGELSDDRLLGAAVGEITIFGSASLTKGSLLATGSGLVALSGEPAQLGTTKGLQPSQGAITITPQNAALLRSRLLIPDAGAIVLAWPSGSLDVIVTLMASSKAFTLHSYGATFEYLAIGWVAPPMPPRPIITKGTAKASFNVATVNTKWGL